MQIFAALSRLKFQSRFTSDHTQYRWWVVFRSVRSWICNRTKQLSHSQGPWVQIVPPLSLRHHGGSFDLLM